MSVQVGVVPDEYNDNISVAYVKMYSNPLGTDLDGDFLDDNAPKIHNGTVLVPKDNDPHTYHQMSEVFEDNYNKFVNGKVSTNYVYDNSLSEEDYVTVDEIIIQIYEELKNSDSQAELEKAEEILFDAFMGVDSEIHDTPQKILLEIFTVNAIANVRKVLKDNGMNQTIIEM